MSPAHYRLSIALAASLSLTLAGCGTSRQATAPAKPDQPPVAAPAPDEEVSSEATIWSVLGLAKKESQRQPGPLTGTGVSPVLWQAALDTLDFVRKASADPVVGALVTDWYSPPGKPDERLRVSVFVLSRALRSDSIAVNVERQVHDPAGQWAGAPVERKLADELVTTILRRARQLRHDWEAQPS